MSANADGRSSAFLANPRLSPGTRRAYAHDLAHFSRWLGRRRLDVSEVSEATLADYVTSLGRRRPGRTPERLSPASIRRRLAAVHAFLLWVYGPAAAPRLSVRLRSGGYVPYVPSVFEIDASFAALEGSTPLAMRNRAIVELIYSAGLRSAEAVTLDIADVDLSQRDVYVSGKGAKDRTVPLGEEAHDWLRHYLLDARPMLLRSDPRPLFLSRTGRRLDTSTVRRVFPGPHALRHAFATHLLDGGAHLRAIQDMLGHESLRTTQGYTAVSRRHLQRTYALAHPRS